MFRQRGPDDARALSRYKFNALPLRYLSAGITMSDWTFGAVKARNMAVEAYCQNASCRRFYVFDLDHLIAEMGADYLVSDIPQLDCQACGSPMEIKLAMMRPEEDGETP
jgi:uncharacterized SAM-dependent methyltransferase